MFYVSTYVLSTAKHNSTGHRWVSELHQEMGHLGTERVQQLAREQFYWPHMQKDITHFVTRVCSCLKQRRPNLPTRAPL